LTEHITGIKGADGQVHSYKTEIFPLRELVNLELELGKIMGGAAGPGIDYLWGLFAIDKDGIHLRGDPDSSTDSTKLGKAIAAIPGGIIEAGGYDFIERIMAKTSREVDFKGDGTALSFQPLFGKPVAWADQVYPGNLGELHLAVLWVLSVNFSPFGRGPSWSLNSLWDELQKRMPTGLIQSTETETSKPDGKPGTPKPTD
jgi:hypothetical protein